MTNRWGRGGSAGCRSPLPPAATTDATDWSRTTRRDRIRRGWGLKPQRSTTTAGRREPQLRAVPAATQPAVVGGDDDGAGGGLRAPPRARRPAPGRCGWSARRAAAGRAPAATATASPSRRRWPTESSPTGVACRSAGSRPRRPQRRPRRPLGPDQRVVRRAGAAARVVEPDVLGELGDPPRGDRRPSPTSGSSRPASTPSSVDLPEPLAPDTSRCSPASTSSRGTRQPPGDLEVAHLRRAGPRAPAAVRSAPQPSGGRGLRTCSRSAIRSRRSASRLRRASVRSTLRPLEAVDELVVVARRPVVGDRRGPDPRRGAQPVQLLLLRGVGLLPAPPGGRPVLLVRRPAAAEPPPALPVGAERPTGRGRRGRCTRRRAGPGRGWRGRPRPAGRAGTPSASRRRRRRGGWSARPAAGRSAGSSSRSPVPAGSVRRPTASRPRRPGSSAPSPSRSAASAARRSASHASCATARSSAAAYAVCPASSARSAESRSTSATIRRRGASAPASTAPIVACSRNGGSWPSITRSAGTSTVPETTARAGSVPASARSSVDLPEPFSPTRPVRRPGETVRSRPCRT